MPKDASIQPNNFTLKNACRKSGPQGLIFDIRKYTLHDGPGVRTTVFFKGCPLACRWCCNPESQAGQPELIWVRERCLGCDLCLKTCTKGALKPAADGGKSIDRERCDRCGECALRCPGEALNLLGRWMTVDEVLTEVTRDALYFEASGGGMTLSGGEPLIQADFAYELLWRYKHEEKGRHAAVETCGFVDWSVIERVAPEVDLFLYDLKHLDPDEHVRLTGQGNPLILENARRLAVAGHGLVIRLPLIAGFNDGRHHLEAVAEFTRSLPGVRRIDLLPYHRLGEPKYHRLGKAYALAGRPALSREAVKQAQELMEAQGLDVTVGG
jgi:pyruvate formate lyase activating enzyme